MNTTKIGYKGIVTFKYKRDNRIYKIKQLNEGLPNLFKFISLCLTGDVSNLSAARPQFMDLKYSTDGTTWNSCLSAKAPVTPSYREVEDNGELNYSAIFTTTISQSMIDKNKLTGNPTCALYLLSGSNVSGNDEEARLARLMVDTESINNLASGVQVLIEWEMEFSNQSDSGLS